MLPMFQHASLVVAVVTYPTTATTMDGTCNAYIVMTVTLTCKDTAKVNV